MPLRRLLRLFRAKAVFKVEDTATGTIAGGLAGMIVGALIFGLDDYETAPWKVTAGLIAVGGIIGFFIGRRAENKNL